MTAIKTEKLTKRYKNLTAVDGMSLEVGRGESFALLGVNGAGKTTVVRMLSCLVTPTEGDARILGYSIVREPEKIKSLIGVSPQESAVAPSLSVRENLELIAGIYGYSRRRTDERINELSDTFNLNGVLKRKAGKLSGGYKRRLSIAMALISEPEILFLDEPTLGLDVIARRELWDTIRSLRTRVTVILTTHYMEEAVALCDRIGIMKGGRLLAVGTAEELTGRTGACDFEEAFISIVKEGTL